MLVLSRKKNESIVINDDITIVVVEIRGDKVRLGVEAPKEVPVHRREVFDAIHRNEAAAAARRPPTRPMPPATAASNKNRRFSSPALSVCLLLRSVTADAFVLPRQSHGFSAAESVGRSALVRQAPLTPSPWRVYNGSFRPRRLEA